MTTLYILTPKGEFLKKPHGNEGRRAGRKASRKLIPPQAAIFSARIRPSCGSASAGIRPLVRESPSIKIHDGWPGAESSHSRERKGRRKGKKKARGEGENARWSHSRSRDGSAARTRTRVFCILHVRAYVRARTAVVGTEDRAPFHKIARLINIRRRPRNKLAAALNTCFCTLVYKASSIICKKI